MSDTILHHPSTEFNTQTAPQRTLTDDLSDARALLARLHRGGEFWYYSRAAGSGYEQDWRGTGEHGRPRRAWLENDHVYFSVNPHRAIPKTNAAGETRNAAWVRGTAENVYAINCLFVDLDAKETITEAEWLPYYVAPDVTGMKKQAARGALQQAQTAAIDKALVQDLAGYKRRAFDAVVHAPRRPSAVWDSGGGYQAVWLLDQTVTIDDTNRADVKHMVRAWVALVGGDPAASDLNRVLRLPGSVNRKPKYGPDGHDVRFVWCDLDLAYSVDELAGLLPMPTAAGSDQTATTPRPKVYVPSGLPQDLGTFGDVPQLPRHPAIEAYNTSTDLRDLLLQYGYTDAGSDRMRRPGGTSGSVQLRTGNTSLHFSSSDPLYSTRRITPAHVLAVYEYDGDAAAMLTALTGVQRPPVAMDEAQKWRLLAWAQSRVARDLLRDVYDIRRPDGYLRTIEALIVLAAERECWGCVPGMRAVAERCNASGQNISRHLTWLNGTLFQTWQTDRGMYVDLSLLYWMAEAHPYAKCYTPTICDDVDAYAIGDSVFAGEKQGPVTLSVGVRFQHDTLQHDAFVPVAYLHGISRRLAPTVLLRSLGHAGRVAWAAVLEAPGITRAEIAEQSGVSGRTLEKTLLQMERAGLVTAAEDADGAKQYTLADDAAARLEDLLPHMTSYKTGMRYAEIAEGSRATWLYKKMVELDTERKAAIRKAGGDTDKRAACARLYDVKLDELDAKLDACDTRQVYLCAALIDAGIRPAKGRRKPWLRWDRQEMDRESVTLAADLQSLGGTRSDKIRMATMAGWTPTEINQAMRPSVVALVPQLAAAGD